MDVDSFQNQQILLFHCSITCIYYTIILIYLHSSDKLNNFKFISILSILVFIELIKLIFTICRSDHMSVRKLDLNIATNPKKIFLKIIKDIIKFFLSIIGITIFYYITIVLYGAPLFTHYEETLLLAITLTILTLSPASLYLGIDNALSLFINSQLPMNGIIVDAVILNVKVVLLVTWLSAFVLPLDWDRPWQVWPIPCIIGALLGYFAAHFIIFIKISIRRFNKKSKKYETLKTY